MRTQPTGPEPKLPEKHYLNDNYGIRSWLLTKDHKRIAILYLVSISIMFLLGGIAAMTIRLDLEQRREYTLRRRKTRPEVGIEFRLRWRHKVWGRLHQSS